jgi:propanol-preferring alcohol dehydrogenase
MKAMLLQRPAPVDSAPLQLADVPEPEPGERMIRIRVEACGICRTDLHVVEGELPPVRANVIPGHQVVGRVEQLGSGASRFAVGTRVGIAWLRETCGRCERCGSGRENLCTAARFTGYHEHGGYAEHAVVREDFAYEIPEPLAAAEATPLLCAGIIGYRALRRAEIRAGCRLGLYGFGASAHIAIQVARHLDCEVYVMTRDERHRALARELGAAWTGGTTDRPPVALQSAIIFAPVGEIVPHALSALDRGGTLALAGIYLTDIPSLNYERHLFYERQIRSVTANTRADGEELLRLAAEIPLRPTTTAFPLAEANRALQQLKHDAIRGAGVLTVSEA